MTIRELVHKQQFVDETKKYIQKLNYAAGSDASIHDVLNHTFCKLMDGKGIEICKVLENAYENLDDYGKLLDDIAAATEISWPPECTYKK